jgi:MFS family permease
MLLLFTWPPWWAVLLARLGTGAGTIAISTTQFAAISSRVAPEERGQLMGLATSLSYVGNLTGFVLGGVLATWWAEAGNFALAAATYAFVMLVAVRLELRTRRSRQPSGPAAQGRSGRAAEPHPR